MVSGDSAFTATPTKKNDPPHKLDKKMSMPHSEVLIDLISDTTHAPFPHLCLIPL